MGFLIDNIVRLALIGVLKRARGFSFNIGEVPIMLSMIAGISTIGFWGVIIGPSILSVALASVDLYKDSDQNQDRPPEVQPFSPRNSFLALWRKV